LQRAGAEAAAARARVRLRETAEAVIEQENARRAAEADWLEALSVPCPCLEILPLFSGALVRRDVLVRRAEAEATDASEYLSNRMTLWREAIHRHDAARASARKVAKRLARQDEEEALQDGADMFLQRWGRR